MVYKRKMMIGIITALLISLRPGDIFPESTYISYAASIGESINYRSYADMLMECARMNRNGKGDIFTGITINSKNLDDFVQYLQTYFLGSVPIIKGLSVANSNDIAILISTEKLDERMQQHEWALSSLKSIAELAEGRSVNEKVIYFRDYLNSSASYDYSLSNKTVYELLINGTGVCHCFATAFQYLCELSGIKCTYVLGDLDGISHAWNEVNVEGTLWKGIDITNPVTGTPYITSTINYHEYKKFMS